MDFVAGEFGKTLDQYNIDFVLIIIHPSDLRCDDLKIYNGYDENDEYTQDVKT